MDRPELADFLRRSRERLAPADVGLPPGARRRTPGLRRDEVSNLAGMSTDYYTRLEQARGPHPSVPVLAGLARALRLTDDGRDHLFLLAGQPVPHRAAAGTHVGPGLMHLLAGLERTPAFVISDIGETLVQNRMSVVLSGDVRALPPRSRNHTWRWFADVHVRDFYPPEDHARMSLTHVSDLRATAARRQGEADIEALVAELRAVSEEFDRLWTAHTVAVRRSDNKRIVHPEVGVLDLLCDHFVHDSSGQTLVMLHPRPGTDAQEKLDLLRVIGEQDLTPAR